MSQLEAQEKAIRGHTFKVFKLPPLDAQDVLIDIGQAFAPALGKGMSAVGSLGSADSPLDLDVDDPRISTALATLAQNISKAKMRELINTMAGVSWCDGKKLPAVMDAVFRGDLPLMYQWLWFALTVNFGNFTEWLGGAIKNVSNLTKAAQSQTISGDTGQP